MSHSLELWPLFLHSRQHEAANTDPHRSFWTSGEEWLQVAPLVLYLSSYTVQQGYISLQDINYIIYINVGLPQSLYSGQLTADYPQNNVLTWYIIISFCIKVVILI